MLHLHVQQFIPENWANTKLQSTIFTKLLHIIEFSSTTVFLYATENVYTACPREVATRGGHPLGLIEYIIQERVHRVFLPYELHKFGIFWNLHQPKGVPSLAFINLYVLIRGAPT